MLFLSLDENYATPNNIGPLKFIIKGYRVNDFIAELVHDIFGQC